MAVEWIGFHVTDRCQLDCRHCLRDPAQKPKDIDVALVRSVLEQGRRLYGAHHAVFTGGEPTLHPGFVELVDAAVDLGYTWHPVTNGRRFAQLVASFKRRPLRRERLTPPTLSLDGADEATHDAIRGAGSFREVMAAVAVCAAHDIEFSLAMVLNAKNQHQVEAMGLLASQLGAKLVAFGWMQPTGTPHDRDLYLSPRAWRVLQDRVDRLAAILKIEVQRPEGWHSEQRFHVCGPFQSKQLHVDVEGNLNVCCMHSGVPGNGRLDVGGDLHELSLPEAHGRVVDIIHQAQRDRVAELASEPPDAPRDEWDSFPCNVCLERFGKPHWSEAGAAGPGAERERWRGAWAKSLPIVR